MITPLTMTEKEFLAATDEELVSAYMADGETESGARAYVAEIRNAVLD